MDHSVRLRDQSGKVSEAASSASPLSLMVEGLEERAFRISASAGQYILCMDNGLQ
jgi:hypothetical protein